MSPRLAFAAGLLALTACRPAAPPPRRHLVEVRQMAFAPEALTVTAGDSVVWVNRDFLPHTATADAPDGWGSRTLPPDSTGLFIAERPGTVTYHCALHPTMVGRIIIR